MYVQMYNCEFDIGPCLITFAAMWVCGFRRVCGFKANLILAHRFAGCVDLVQIYICTWFRRVCGFNVNLVLAHRFAGCVDLVRIYICA